VSGISRKHTQSLQRLSSLAFGVGTFAYAKDQASSPHDGLHEEKPTLTSQGFSGFIFENDRLINYRRLILKYAQTVMWRGRRGQ